MKAKYTFEIMELDDEKIAVPVGAKAEQFHGVLKVNDTAIAILKLLTQSITEEKIVEELMKDFEGEEIAANVHEFLNTLKTEGLVE